MSAEELRELDRFCASAVMKWKKRPDKSTRGLRHGEYDIVYDGILIWTGMRFAPTTNDADAMAVLMKCVQKLPLHIEISHNGTNWFVSRPDEDEESYVLADTLPLAICLFAKRLFEK